MEIRIEKSWNAQLEPEFSKPYFHKLVEFIKNEYRTQTIFPAGKHIFQAFDSTPFDKVKVVILGQDPYHGAGQAHGLSFSVQDGIAIPPSLVNIFKEISAEYCSSMPTSGNLERWASQGVLLLNTVLTVQANTPQSHKGQGWEQFTDAVITTLNRRQEPIVFMLWGAPAQTKAELITAPYHLVLTTSHPSPLSSYRGFLGCGHFQAANQFLVKKGLTPIEW